MIELFSDYTFRTVFFGTAGIGAVSGSLGCFAYLRKQSLIGDVVSHSSLFGIMLFFLASYLITGQGSRSLWVLVPGAIFAGVASLILTRWIVEKTSVRDDSGLGVMLAIFFGSGIVMLRWVQNAEPAIPGRRGLDGYLFGMAASMTQSDLVMIGVLGFASIALMLAFWKQLKVFTFDPLFSQSLGYKSRTLDLLLLTLLVNGIVIGIQCVGVVLMIAMLVTPAAAARQWTRSLGAMISLAAALGAFCAMAGSLISASFVKVPTGPVIVLAGVVVFLFSILFAPRRGVIWRPLSQAGVERGARSRLATATISTDSPNNQADSS